MTAALDGIRVLDLCNRRGELAGRLLADLGAEVIKVEPPGGCDSRRLHPFGPDGTSLFWATYGAGKSSRTIDLATQDGVDELCKLAAGADVLIESFDPGEARSMGIGYERLSVDNPGLIYMAISPFGQTGPKANWPASELTLEAAGGRLAIQGDPDRPPLPVGYPQAYLHGGAQAAADIVIALNERVHSGLGQFLDLSMQEVMWWTLMAAQGSPVCLGDNPPFSGDDRGPVPQGQGPRTAAAKDGLVTIAAGASPPGTRTMYTFAIEEARDRGELDAVLDLYDWDNWVTLYRGNAIDPGHMALANTALDNYISRRTKLELVDWALRNNLRLGPLNNTRDLIAFPHYQQRDFFADIGGIQQPAHWVRMSRTSLEFVPAPAAGSGPTPSWSRRPSLPVTTDRKGLAFEGLKVADFSWVAAGPTVSKALADHGATVVKLESSTRPDLSRTLAPHIDGQPGLNRSYWSFLYATSKLSLQCHLGLDPGKKLARRVCDWADVVIESFSPGTMARMGLDYETLSKDHPELIMFSTSMLGQTGPLSHYAGYGQQASGFCGLHYITGWPDREPCGVATPYTDVIAPKFGIASLAAAILEARGSGQGQHIDLAQAECGMMFLAPLLLDETVNGRTAERDGYNALHTCIQGVYPCSGIERYIAIATETDHQWQSLCQLIPSIASLSDRTFEQRYQARSTIHDLIGDWTRNQAPFELERRLTTTGVPASVVQRSMDVFEDPQIEARQIKQTLFHEECGDVVHYGFPTRFSARAEMVRGAPPCIGAHNEHVMGNLLGMSESEIQDMMATGAIQ